MNSNSRSSKRNTRGRRGGGFQSPPQLPTNVTFSHVYRFVSTSGTTTSLTPTSVLCAAGTICTVTNTTVTSLFSAVRVNFIRIWSPPASQGASATCSVDWVGFSNTPNFEASDTTVSVARPAFIMTKPPKQSLANFWMVTGTTTFCNVTAPSGSIIDIGLSLVVADADGAAPATTAVATGVLGTPYFLSLDPNASNRFRPVSMNTTT